MRTRLETCLQPSFTELLNRDFDFNRRIFQVPHCSPEDTTEPSFPNHNGAAKVLSRSLEISNAELSEITFSSRRWRVRVLPPHGRLRARPRGISRVEIRPASVYVAVGEVGGQWDRLGSLVVFLFLVTTRELETLHCREEIIPPRFLHCRYINKVKAFATKTE